MNGIDLSPDGSTLAVADSSTQGTNNRIELVYTATGVATPISFPLALSERGTNMVAWGTDNQVLVSSDLNGSGGGVPLRRYDPQTNTTTTVATLTQSAVLTPSADRNTIAITEPNINIGPIRDYDVPTHSFRGTVTTIHYMLDVAVNANGSKFVGTTFDGAFVYDKVGDSDSALIGYKDDNTFLQQGRIGGQRFGPLAAVFSPINNVLFTSELALSGSEYGVRVYDSNTLSLIQTIDPYQFPHPPPGDFAMGSGRMEISPDGRFLAVSVNNAVRLYDVSAYVPEPTMALLVTSVVSWFMLRRGNRCISRSKTN